MTGSRIIVEAPIYEKFLERFAAKARTLKMGDPRDPHTVIGPLIRASQCQMMIAEIKEAVAAGARISGPMTVGSRGSPIFRVRALAAKRSRNFS